jgi:hypothetical protein
MQTVTTIGLGIAKSVFQVHGIDAQGNVVTRQKCAGAALSIHGCAGSGGASDAGAP